MKRKDLQSLVIASSRPLLRATPRESRRIGEIDTRLGQGWTNSNHELELVRGDSRVNPSNSTSITLSLHTYRQTLRLNTGTSFEYAV